MRESNLNPAPREWLEKACDSNIVFFLPAMILLVTFQSLLEGWEFRASLAALVLAVHALPPILTLVLKPFVVPLKRRRVALDAERGIFECGHRGVGCHSFKSESAGRTMLE